MYSVTIFLSAFLIFLVQPIIGKIILPVYGGAPAVWTTCMVFFQAVLLLGYGYAHLLVSRCSSRARFRIHLSVLFFACITLPLSAAQLTAGATGLNPIASIFVSLLIGIGLPYFAMTATAPLLQGSLTKYGQNDSIYKLYAVSNIGSLGALFLYPAIFEPSLKISGQLDIWSLGFLVVSVLVSAVLWRTDVKKSDFESLPLVSETSPITGHQVYLWAILSACGSVILLAASNQISQNIAAVPFLWILPLALYLMSYIAAFSGYPLYSLKVWFTIFTIALFFKIYWALTIFHPSLGFRLIGECVVVFASLMLCHGELARQRPKTESLTIFYFTSSLGGVLGSLFVACAAPFVYQNYSEVAFGFLLCALLTIIASLIRSTSHLFSSSGRIKTAISLATLAAFAVSLVIDRDEKSLISRRSFFGVVSVTEKNSDIPDYHFLRMHHGTIVHGTQLQAAGKRTIPTTYYGEQSGIGIVLQKYKSGKPRRIGVIGLGTGTIAVYGTKDDFFRYYEINNDVTEIAESIFSYLKDSKSRYEIIPGDARISLSLEESNQFDILLVDAFSGDSIPTHLLTREAGTEYLRHVNQEGILVFHVSNQFLDLVPVVSNVATELGLSAYSVKDPGILARGQSESTYVIVPRRPFSPQLLAATPALIRLETVDGQRSWTDDYSDLFSVLRFWRR